MGIIACFLAGVAAHHFLYYLLKNKLVPTVLFGDGSKADRDVLTAEVSKRLVSTIFGLISVVIGVCVITETHHDILYAKSDLLEIWIPLLSWYFIYDVYAMCDVLYLKIKSKQLPLMALLIRLFTMKSFFIIHHIFVFLLVPVVYSYTVKKGLGHMPFGCLCLTEISAPFISFTYILNLLHKSPSTLYTVLGACAVLSFIYRVLMIPLLYVYYGIQYGLGPVGVITTMMIKCHLFSFAFTIIQIAWLLQILRVTIKHVKRTKD